MHSSKRVPRSLEPNRLSRQLALSRPELDLTVSNPTAVGFTYPEEELLAALMQPASLRYAPEPQGLLAARTALAEWYRGAVGPEQIFLTSSTSESYSWLFKLLCDPGDRILVPRPSYPLFECLAHLDAVEVAQYPLLESLDWAIDFEALASLVTERTRAIVIVNPNNPTGSFLKRWELDLLVEICQRYSLALISDEVFSVYGFSEDPSRVSSLAGEVRAPVFVLNGMSKPAALPQMKLGWLISPKEAVERLEWIADAYLPVSAPVQHALSRWLALMPRITEQALARTLGNYAVLRTALQGSAAKVLTAEGGWAAILELPRVLSEEEWVLAFARQGVLLQPGFFYDFDREAFAVASLLLPFAETNKAVKKIQLTLIESIP